MCVNTEPIPQRSEFKYAYGTLVECSEAIVAGLSKDPKALVISLRRTGFVSDDTVEEIVDLPVTRTNNARKLYSVILNCVKHHPHKYTDFITILQENDVLYCDLLKTLEETYVKKGLLFISHLLVSWSDVYTHLLYLSYACHKLVLHLQ